MQEEFHAETLRAQGKYPYLSPRSLRLCASLFFVLFAMSAMAEDFVAPKPPDETPVLPTIEQRRAAVEGVVAKIFNVQKPWQLVNPDAPASYGDGKSNGTVSYSEKHPGKPKGFIVFAIEW